MKNLIRLGFTAFICIAVSLLTINNTFAQGEGKGKGKGLIENRGIQNGEGFTTGQGHLNGNSAVYLGPDCVDEAMVFFLENPDRFWNVTRLSKITFSVDSRDDDSGKCMRRIWEAYPEEYGCYWSGAPTPDFEYVPCPDD